MQGLLGRGPDKAESADGAGFMAKAAAGEGGNLSHRFLPTSVQQRSTVIPFGFLKGHSGSG